MLWTNTGDSKIIESERGVSGEAQRAEVDVNEEFYEAYVFGPPEGRLDAIERFCKSPDCNRNHDEGVFFVRAAENGDQDFLQRLIDGNTDEEALANGLFTALLVAADRKNKGLIEFLFGQGADPQCSITRYSVYTRDPDIKTCIDEQIKKDKQ